MNLRCIFGLCFLLSIGVFDVSGNGVLRIQHRFSGQNITLNDLKAYDGRRHRRFLAGVDLPLGGIGHPTDAGLYYAKIGIGTPAKDFYVQVDTGSDVFWVNCIQCTRCPKKSKLGIDLTLYNPKDSVTGKLVTCDDDFCSDPYGLIPGCTANKLCPYIVLYGDGSSTAGFYVRDIVQYNQVSGNLITTPANGSVVFGCGAKQSGDLGSSNIAVDGILGFGQSNLSMISQLAAAGQVKKMFAHCLDGVNGGGIFAIGEVVQPKVKTTPLIPNQTHYNVNLKSIEVGGDVLQLPANVSDVGGRKGTIIDSGTTLAYVPKVVYDPLITMIMSQQSDLKLITLDEQFSCFQYSESVDDGFPTVTFYFENSVSLMVYPHQYLFQHDDNLWCIGWQNSGMQSRDGRGLIVLGDLVLSNKLVLYDLENQVMGWTDYNCSSNLKVKDDQSGAIHLVGAHDLSSSCSLSIGRVMILLLLTALMPNLMYCLIVW